MQRQEGKGTRSHAKVTNRPRFGLLLELGIRAIVHFLFQLGSSARACRRLVHERSRGFDVSGARMGDWTVETATQVSREAPSNEEMARYRQTWLPRFRSSLFFLASPRGGSARVDLKRGTRKVQRLAASLWISGLCFQKGSSSLFFS